MRDLEIAVTGKVIFERILLDLIKLEFRCHYRDALFTSFSELLFMHPELRSYQICAMKLC